MSLPLVPGLFAVLMMRPHVSLIIFVGLVFALLVRKAPARSYAAPLARVLGLGVLLVLGVFLAGQTASFLGQDSLTTESVDVELSAAEDQTGEGGSAFDPVRVNTPFDIVPAFATVFFRPFVFEVDNTQGLLTAAEGMLLLGLAIASRHRLRSIPSMIRTTPYVAFSIGYVLAFTFAFSSFGNFGILARQRVQAIPLLLVLLALPVFRYRPSMAGPRRRGTRARQSRPVRPRSRRPPPRRRVGPPQVVAGPPTAPGLPR